VTNSVNTVNKEVLKCKAKLIVLIVLIQRFKVKEEKEKKRAKGFFI
jgi:hypothetical protein